MSWVQFLKFKSQAFENLKKSKALVEKQSRCFIKTLCTDREKEFLFEESKRYCEEQGIRHELRAPYTPQQNEVAKRKNRIVVEMSRSLLKEKALSNKFWVEVVTTLVYFLDICPTKVVRNLTQFEAWKCIKPSV